jgi:hypothetical protein
MIPVMGALMAFTGGFARRVCSSAARPAQTIVWTVTGPLSTDPFLAGAEEIGQVVLTDPGGGDLADGT